MRSPGKRDEQHRGTELREAKENQLPEATPQLLGGRELSILEAGEGKLRKSSHCIELSKVSTRTFRKFRKDEKVRKARGS